MKTCRRGHQHNMKGNCPICRKEYNEKNKEKLAEGNKKWIANNRNRYLANAKVYREKNAPVVREAYREWESKNPVHSIWRGIKRRCYNPASEKYKDYGARGITVCDRWLGENGYKNFEADMGPRPSKDHSVERKNTNGNYEPSNCTWATRGEQQRNRRENRMVTIHRRTQCMAAWCEELGIGFKTFQKRVDNGWTDDQLLSPVKSQFRTKGRTGMGKKAIA